MLNGKDEWARPGHQVTGYLMRCIPFEVVI